MTIKCFEFLKSIKKKFKIWIKIFLWIPLMIEGSTLSHTDVDIVCASTTTGFSGLEGSGTTIHSGLGGSGITVDSGLGDLTTTMLCHVFSVLLSILAIGVSSIVVAELLLSKENNVFM